ncbi:hypothetical protein [Mesobacillus stamsii]|uniref:Uncharacterized protein n=1 Tax=Mesobacillus stamsii TaxID=225347 RepID=A0ABU0FU72_9BACI|nr:hypothetical protein [Mesobacillus stamsii]MDQ0412899.1 hypothetical protein [Mesobacillus stamsii]
MEIGGLMVYAFKVFLGNPDIMAALITWAILTTLALTVIEIFKDLKL